MFWLCLLAACTLETVGDILLKKGAITKSVMAYGLGSYLIGTILWATALKYQNLSRALPIFSIASSLAGVLCGLIFFHETLTPTQWFGILCGCLCLGLI